MTTITIGVVQTHIRCSGVDAVVKFKHFCVRGLDTYTLKRFNLHMDGRGGEGWDVRYVLVHLGKTDNCRLRCCPPSAAEGIKLVGTATAVTTGSSCLHWAARTQWKSSQMSPLQKTSRAGAWWQAKSNNSCGLLSNMLCLPKTPSADSQDKGRNSFYCTEVILRIHKH